MDFLDFSNDVKNQVGLIVRGLRRSTVPAQCYPTMMSSTVPQIPKAYKKAIARSILTVLCTGMLNVYLRPCHVGLNITPRHQVCLPGGVRFEVICLW